MAPTPRQLSDVEVFVRVVEAGGYAAAAQALGVSRSHASRLVSGLEARLGMRLLNRTTRRVVPTQTGRTFYAECAPLIEALIAAEARAASERAEAVGVLRVSLPAHFGQDYLGPPLARFQDVHPGLDMLLDYSDRKVDIVADGFDVAVRGGSVDDSSLVARRLWPFSARTYASPAYLAANGPLRSPAHLSEHRCLLYAHATRPRDWRLHRGAEEVPVLVSGSTSSTSTRALAEAAAAGRGVVYLPDFAVKGHVDRGELVRVLPEWGSPPQWFWAVRTHRSNLPARVRLFVEFLSELWPVPPWAGS